MSIFKIPTQLFTDRGDTFFKISVVFFDNQGTLLNEGLEGIFNQDNTFSLPRHFQDRGAFQGRGRGRSFQKRSRPHF